ncbi:DUF6797 domain-containing protein [Alienimonas californiensis]|uniref:DUF6797 domain-containing protein n=1 Tax=Alienimonas californiensis TaxID=2527989 RepID=UPI001A99AA7F|nr:DUF6797 domain-containing protein [Alienimonas californiensis]
MSLSETPTVPRPQAAPDRTPRRPSCITAALIFAPALLVAPGTVAPGTAAAADASLHERLQQADPAVVAREARLRGDAARGALVYYTSAAACVNCHAAEQGRSPLGPDLTQFEEGVTDAYLVEALLKPSKAIREGYRTVQLLKSDGQIVSGMFVREDDAAIVLRDAENLERELAVPKADVLERGEAETSLMPDGLAATLPSERAVLDLLKYLFALRDGGPARAAELKPPAEQLVVQDDTANLNHARIVAAVENGSPRRGRDLYRSNCEQCHGPDGDTPSLATARAFGKEPLKFGADPYGMFQTLSRGNGLMRAMPSLSPRERYEVVGYIRNEFMKDSNPSYRPVTEEYLDALPKGTEDGEFEPPADRDHGPALASQLGREVESALTIWLGELSISYDLHSMDQAGLWSGGFLNLDATQHKRLRGEGYAQPGGKSVPALDLWRWGHDGTLDYPTDDLLPRGPLPERWLDYHGHYLHGDRVVLSYAIDGREILEVPSPVKGRAGVRHTLRIGPGPELILAAGRSGPDAVPPQLFGEIDGLVQEVDEKGRWVVRIPAGERSRLIDVLRFASTEDDRGAGELAPLDPAHLLAGGGLRWPETLETVGLRGLQTGAYAVDTLTLPEASPWNAWFRTAALDFFPDGRMAVATVGGDVWIVSGIDDDLLNLRWQRYAGGLYEPFGLKIVDGRIYVTCKDRLTRLHDRNADGEADFYESFSSDTDVSTYYHAFNFDLQTDDEGNFYYAKSGQYTDYQLPGAVVKISPDGQRREVVATGFRTPNGMGALPDGRIVVSDNQGNWMPASKINLLEPGAFYGYVQTHASGAWAPDGGAIDHKKVVPPESFDPPMLWMPQEVDNSSGGQVFVDDPRFGPLAGRLLHTSFGQGRLFYLMTQEIDGRMQAAVVRFPHDFDTGIMRANVNPADGQVYVTGMSGWNANGRGNLADGGIARVRYTGKPMRMLADCQVVPEGLQLSFNFPLDPSVPENLEGLSVTVWNYKWTAGYGSPTYRPDDGKPGTQELEIAGATLSEDGRTLTLRTPDLRPVDQLHLEVNVRGADGTSFSEEVYWTIHNVPDQP